MSANLGEIIHRAILEYDQCRHTGITPMSFASIFAETINKEYYEVEFIRKEEKEEWQEKGGDNLC